MAMCSYMNGAATLDDASWTATLQGFVSDLSGLVSTTSQHQGDDRMRAAASCPGVRIALARGIPVTLPKSHVWHDAKDSAGLNSLAKVAAAALVVGFVALSRRRMFGR